MLESGGLYPRWDARKRAGHQLAQAGYRSEHPILITATTVRRRHHVDGAEPKEKNMPISRHRKKPAKRKISSTQRMRWTLNSIAKLLTGANTVAEAREKLNIQQARALRLEHNLCQHQDDIRIYASRSEADADQAEALRCALCGRDRLRHKLTSQTLAELMQNKPEEASNRMQVTQLLYR
jgi:hypothetical protein